jgi:amidase
MTLATDTPATPGAPALPVRGLAASARALADGSTTSRALIDAHLARIALLDEHLNAFRVVRADGARTEADAADARLAAGHRLPLLGVPVAIKDDTHITGETTPFGTGGTHPTAGADAALVTRLRDAGAIIVGKTNTPELGQWPFTEGPGFGASRNPWALDRTPGGSSGGSAAAVAAGLVPAAVGSDGAGSVRIPAAWCGLVGVKPTRGRVPTAPEAEPFHGLTCHGPLARTVGDAALLLDVLAGTGRRYTQAAERDPGRLRIGLSWRTPLGVPGRVHPDVRTAVQGLAQRLRELGHEVIDAEPEHQLAGALFLPRGMHGVHEALGAMGDAAHVEGRTRTHARLGSLLGGPVLAAARALERPLAARMGRVFARVDVLVTPTTASPALRIGELHGRSYWPTGTAIEAACPYAFPWNVVGWPGVSVPAGTDASGVPLGAQLLGRTDDEELLLSLAGQVERAGDAPPWPPLAGLGA